MFDVVSQTGVVPLQTSAHPAAPASPASPLPPFPAVPAPPKPPTGMPPCSPPPEAMPRSPLAPAAQLSGVAHARNSLEHAQLAICVPTKASASGPIPNGRERRKRRVLLIEVS